MTRRSPLFLIFITVFIDLIGFGIVIPILPYYVSSPRFNASPFTLGLIVSSYSIMQLIFSPILGGLSDRHGRRPVLLLSMIGTGIGYLILGFAGALWMLFAGRILDGITGGNISTAYAYVADVTTKENRAKGMGMIGAAFGLGFIVGPALGGVLSKFGINVPFFFAGGLAFANSILLYFMLPETVTKDHPARNTARPNIGEQIASAMKRPNLSMILLIYFLFIFSFSIMTTAFAYYTMHRYGYNEEQNGYIFAFIGLIAVIVQGGLIGRLVKRFGESIFVILGAAIFGFGLFAMSFVGPSAGGLYGLLGILAILGVGNAMATPSLTGLASKSVGATEQGSALGLTQSSASLARVVGPLVGGWLIYSKTGALHVDDRSIRLTFWTASAIMVVTMFISIYFARMFAGEYELQRLTEDLP